MPPMAGVVTLFDSTTNGPNACVPPGPKYPSIHQLLNRNRTAREHSKKRTTIIFLLLVATLSCASFALGQEGSFDPNRTLVPITKVKIGFAIKRAGNKFTGDYRCAPDNAVCRNNVQRGWVHGQISARGFTVAEEDTSWCVFFVRRFHGAIADGEYTCYMNGGIADLGVFELKHPLGE